MRKRKIDSKVEKQILTAMIMSKAFLAQSAAVIDLDLFEGDHVKIIGKWCLDYLSEYGKAPESDIEGIYHGWAESQEEPDATTDSVHDFLGALSEEYDTAGDINVPYLLDSLAQFLTRKRLSRTKDALEYSLHRGDQEVAEKALLAYRATTIGEGAGIDPLNNEEAWTAAFAEPAQPLIEFPGDAGRFLNQALTRDALVGIQAPEKKGKTWWCIEFVLRALRNRKRVAFFQVGDLSQNQLLLRLGTRLACRPGRKDLCGDIMTPRKITAPEDRDGQARIKGVSKDYPKPITAQACIKAVQRFLRSNGMEKGTPYLKVGIHANTSINVKGIDGVLEGWEAHDGFIPDVIVIDYADILAPEDNGKQARDQVNDTWKALRRLSQERHALVIAPTQADADSYDTDTQSMKNFSEDKRKFAHVTGMLGLNQTDNEKAIQVMRLNWLVLRESPFKATDCLHVGQSIGLGRAFCCGALWHPKRDEDENE